MAKAIWNGKVIAESDQTLIVEGNHYFPPNAVNWEFLSESKAHTVCHWKGEASYHHVQVDGQVNLDAAWYYPSPTEPAQRIKDYIAFWRGVEVIP